ncbi:MAG: hypothetical protein H8E16_21745 [Flavobacteriales bacterium]|nr:hypothetical protein [Flavobacteriales bacterium]
MTIKIAKSNSNKKQAFLNSCQRNLNVIFKLGLEKDRADDVLLLRKAIKNPDLWYRHLAIEK